MSVPNILTGIRLFLVPFFPIVYFCNCDNAHIYASLIFILAMFLDVLDGFIARRFNMITKLGQVFDPVADKLMVISVVSTLVVANKISRWFLCFVLIKEIIMIIGGTVIYGKDKIVIPSNIFGKSATFLMFLFLIDAMYLRIWLMPIATVVVCAMVLALVTYCIKLVEIKLRKTDKNEVAQ